MATVTVVNAERTLEIEATSIVSGEVNEAGHLILTRHDGTPIDVGAVSGMQLDEGTTYSKVDAFTYVGDTDPGAVPDGSVWLDTTDVAGPFASETQKGLIEIASTAEAVAGVDTQRALTPASYSAIPGSKVEILPENANTEGALPGAYPSGPSLMVLTTGSGWSVNTGFGSALTLNTSTDRTVQIFFSNPGGTGVPRTWIRQYHPSNNGGGWTAWAQYNTLYTLTPANFTQATAMASYPQGWSRLYFTTTTATGWDFAGTAGEVMTYSESGYARQIWTAHANSTSTENQVWVRTSNAINGWSPWSKTIFEKPGLPKAMAAGVELVTGGSSANEIVTLDVTFPTGRFTQIPIITLTAVSANPGTIVTEVTVGNQTATGFRIYIQRTNTSGTSVQWIAVQM